MYRALGLTLSALLPLLSSSRGTGSPEPSWFASVVRDLHSRGVVAESRPLWARFDGAWVRFAPTGVRRSWEFSYRPQELRQGEVRRVLENGERQTSGNRLVRVYPGGVREIYENRREGVEQIFHLEQPLRGDGILTLSGIVKYRGEVRGEEGGVSLSLDGREVFRLSGLVVHDATGRELASRMRLHDGSRLDIEVLEEGEYPIVIDPLASTSSWTVDPTDLSGSSFAGAIAFAGDVNNDGYNDVIVAASSFTNDEFAEGRVYCYHGSATGLSTTADWTADPTDQVEAYFGSAIAGAGDVNGDGYCDVVIAASAWDGEEDDEGRVYVYHGSSTGLSSTPSWSLDPTDLDSAYFGSSVACAGDVNNDGYSDVIIGAYGWGGTYADEGKAYLYLGSATGLAATAAWTVDPTDEASAYFGYSVAGAGDINGDGYADLAVSAYQEDGTHVDEGVVYLYHGSSTGFSTTASQTLEPADVDYSYFGYSLASAGDVNGDGYGDLAVGATGGSDDASDEGKAFVFHGSSTGLSATASWSVDPTDQADAAFGFSVACAGDINGDGYTDLLVGANSWDGGFVSEGKAFLYHGGSSGLSTTADWTLEPVDQTLAYFATALSTAGDVNGDGFSDVVIGAYGWSGTSTNEGRAYLYSGSATGLSSSSGWTQEPTDQAEAYFGYSVASAGDVNGDGIGDVIVGAYGYDGDAVDEGRAYVYHGSATGLSTTPSWTSDPTDQASAYFGSSVACAGDVNNDGYSDVIVAASGYSNEAASEGRVYVFLGSSSGLATSASWSLDPTDQASAGFGDSVAGAGDVNGDGYADVIIGASSWSSGGVATEGRAYVYHGSSSGLSTTAAWTLDPTDEAAAGFGWAVSSAGDVNGDGYSDVVIGAPRYDGTASNEGRVYVYHGSSSGLPTTASWTSDPTDQASAEFGSAVGSAGDVNGDGYGDVIVGAQVWDGTAADEGRAYVYHGSSSGLSTTADWSLDPTDQASAGFGSVVGTAGDVNGDGYGDIFVSASNLDATATDEGRVYVYQGTSTGLPTTADWSVDPTDQASAEFGRGAAGAGDVTGDGYADLLIGASMYNGGATDEGRCYLYYGNGGVGRPFLPRQLRPDGTASVQIRAGSGGTSVRLRMNALGMAGPGQVRLQWEAQPLGTAFSLSSISSETWTYVGTTAMELDAVVGSLTADTSYRWRMRLVGRPALYGRWVSYGANGQLETDFRTVAAPSSSSTTTSGGGGRRCAASGSRPMESVPTVLLLLVVFFCLGRRESR